MRSGIVLYLFYYFYFYLLSFVLSRRKVEVCVDKRGEKEAWWHCGAVTAADWFLGIFFSACLPTFRRWGLSVLIFSSPRVHISTVGFPAPASLFRLSPSRSFPMHTILFQAKKKKRKCVPKKKKRKKRNASSLHSFCQLFSSSTWL